MKHHIYIFGSICRGEFDANSDVDLLVCTDEKQHGFDTEKFSVYTYNRIKEMWKDGNPFAWHLYLEARLVYSFDGLNYIESLGTPSIYTAGKTDCTKFYQLFVDSMECVLNSENSLTFNISCCFLGMRNFATCFSLHSGNAIFSRYSPLMISPQAPIDRRVYEIYARCRILSTRGLGEIISPSELGMVKSTLINIRNWMELIMKENFNV